MKKNLILSMLVMTSLILMVGVVSALQVNNVEIINPTAGDSFNENTIEIQWEWVEEITGSVSGGNLQYAKDSCDGPWSAIFHSFGTEETSYEWDTSGLDEGEYCLFLSTNVADKNDKSGLFTIDRTAPDIMMSDVSFPAPDEKDNLVTVAFVHNDVGGVTFCEIDFGGMKTKNCLTGSQKSYQFNDDGNYDVTITVRDEAENEATLTVPVSVANVAPELIDIVLDKQQIDAPNNDDSDDDELVEAAVGEAVLFEATAEDVEDDLEAGLTCEWTFDGSDEVETTADSDGKCEVFYTWTSASEHTVDLTVKDKDGGSVDAIQFELEVEETEHMTPMQQVVAEIEFEFDLDEPWRVGDGNNKKFKTDLIAPVTCEEVVVPTNMVISSLGNTKCKVEWTPSNNQRGEHLVIIKAISGNDYKYYSFDVTVYSWGIHLDKGWNLISIPYMPTSSSIDDVFADIIDNVAYEDTSTATVFQYDAVERVWYRARTTSTHSKFDYVKNHKDEELASIVPGYAYWIKMENEDTIYGVEENFPVNTVPGVNGVDLATESWNLIGRFGVDSASSPWKIALRTLRKPFYNKNYVSSLLGIYGLESVTANGETSWSAATDIELAEGYWIRTSEGEDGRTTIRYEPDSI